MRMHNLFRKYLEPCREEANGHLEFLFLVSVLVWVLVSGMA